jgi:hypothetical protein
MGLRVRVLADGDAGMGTSAVAAKSPVCPARARRLEQRRRQTGEVAPRQARPGPKPGPGAGTPDGDRLAGLATAEPALSAREYRDRLGLPCHPTTVWRALRRPGRIRTAVTLGPRTRPQGETAAGALRGKPVLDLGRSPPGPEESHTVDAYTSFPDYCCLCLRPKPDGTWQVRNSSTKYLGDNRYEVTTASVRVPVCGSCRRNMRLREVAAAAGALVVAALAFGWWYLDTKGDRGYLIAGAVGALIVALVAFLVLGWLFNVPTRTSVAHIEVDGSDIVFANPDYQRLYTGESRQGRQDDADWRQLNWR